MKRSGNAFCLCCALLFALPAVPSPARAQADAGAGISPMESGAPFRKEKKKRPPDPFITILAEYFDHRNEDLQRLWNRGYGRNELIKLLLMRRKADKTLRELVRKRDKGARLSKIAEEYSIDYPQVLAETEKVRSELDYRLAASTNVVGNLMLSTAAAQGAAPTAAPDISTQTPKGRP